MSQGARTAVTLAVLGGLLAVGTLWGWHAATEPLPGKVDSPLCVTTTVLAGEKVYPEQVTVSVYNASALEGLAARTMQLFSDEGFAEGTSGNVDSNISGAEVWTDDPASAAVRLVASHLGPAAVIKERGAPGQGVTVVVGDGFGGLTKGRAKVVTTSDMQFCSPPVS